MTFVKRPSIAAGLPGRRRIAVIGAGISGLAAAWLLSARHDVELFERESRFGGHANTVDVEGAAGPVAVDTGFIVYNEINYPNLTALFRHLQIETKPAPMTFSVSLAGGKLEYGSANLNTVFGQRRNLLRPGFWRFLTEIQAFYAEAKRESGKDVASGLTISSFMRGASYSQDLYDHHIVPMCAAIWSAPPERIGEMPLGAYVRFFASHGLFETTQSRAWRTVTGGSRSYVARMLRRPGLSVYSGAAIRGVRREAGGVTIEDMSGHRRSFDAAVIATHADEALAMLADPSREERRLLGSFGYSRNTAVLHGDSKVMPRRRRVWSSWNYAGSEDASAPLSVTYWMNALQGLDQREQLFVTLNPSRAIAVENTHAAFNYSHPQFDARALAAQRELWRLQGLRNTWFCGAYFGYGFHEDGLQAGLAVAEELGGIRRPWQVPDESGRIHRATPALMAAE